MILSEAFSKNASVLSLVILLSLSMILGSAVYNSAILPPENFLQQPEAENYRESVRQISGLDEWTRTKLYWSNNLRVAGLHGVLFPAYFGFVSDLASSYSVGFTVVYYNAAYGWRYSLAVAAQIFVHGLLELTGLFIVTAATFKLAWCFWLWLGHFAGPRLSMAKLREMWEMAVVHRRAVKTMLLDFLALFSFGMMLIFCAGPVESYVSPVAGSLFLAEPTLAALFLAAVFVFYLHLARPGFRRMLFNMRRVKDDLVLALQRKWRPSQLPVIMLVILVSIFAVRQILA